MQARFFRQLCCVLGALVLAACGQVQDEEPRGPVVLAAASMQGALEEIADAWVADGNARPVLSFSATPALARQVEQGAPADLVITADAAWMDWLAQGGLIDPASRGDIASNGLVVIQRDPPELLADGTLEENLSAFLDPARNIAIAQTDTVPAGRYAKRALQYDGLWDAVADRLVPTESVRAALALVERGEADMGIVYASDALASPDMWSQELPMPEGDVIRYPAARVLAGSHEEAEAFLTFLASDAAQAIFARRGFLPAP